MRALVADDNPSCSRLIKAMVEQNGWEADIAASGSGAIATLKERPYDLLLLDLNLPDGDGFEVLQQLKNASITTEVVLISGCIGVSETVRAMQLGANHCLAKPVRMAEFSDLLARVQKKLIMQAPPASESQSEMVAVSPSMTDTQQMLKRVSRSNTTVLIVGETGTGKEVVSRRLHKVSDRRDKPFVAVNCSAIPASLIESELFGHEKGAFTDARNTRKGFFEAAADGTLFLDEIGDLPIELQSKLLRVLQERSFRRVGGNQEIPLQARIVAATNVDLAEAVEKGKFREDLYYRLAVIPIHLRPLRERTADILPLSNRFIRVFASEFGCPAPELNEEHIQTLLSHPWPGNVRELKNVMERFVLLGGRLEFVASRPANRKPEPPKSEKKDATPIDEQERKVIYEMLLQKLMSGNINGLTSS